MKNLLLYIALGSTTFLSAASVSNSYEDVRQKRDNVQQRTQSKVQQRQPQGFEKQRTMKMQEQSKRTKQYQEQHRQPKKQIDQRNTKRNEVQKTIRMKEQYQRTKQYQKQPKRQIDRSDVKRVEAQRKMKLQEQSKRMKQYQEQHRQLSKPVYQKELQRKHIKSRYTPKERERRITKRIKQRDSIHRTFRTHKEFIRSRPHLRTNYYHRYYKRDYIRRPNIRQVGILYFINNWYFIYRDRHAPFYDQFGYFYGFFNQFGFFFEGIFYAYDRYYTYEDRLRGRGLFDNRYYEPYLEDRYDDWYDSYDDPYYYDEDPYYN